MKKALVVFVVVLGLSVTIGDPSNSLAAQGNQIEFGVVDPELKNYGTVNWEARWERSVIAVCWMNPVPGYEQERQWVRTAIVETWEASSGVRLLGWQACRAGASGIKIVVDESNPRSHVGKESDTRTPSMWLNFSFNTWSPSCQTKRKECITSIAVHEFGHALGFQHEQLQPDAPQGCIEHLKSTGQWEWPSNAPTALTSYDPDSVMNYCNVVYNNAGQLSAKDKRAIQILFPRG